MKFEPRTFTVTHGISRARDTEGYNMITVRDENGRKVASCNGGGYDMHGTVVADTLTKAFPAEVQSLAFTLAGTVYTDNGPVKRDRALYGLNYDSRTASGGAAWIDGACGIRSVETIAKAMGVRISYVNNRRGTMLAFTFAPTGDES